MQINCFNPAKTKSLTLVRQQKSLDSWLKLRALNFADIKIKYKIAQITEFLCDRHYKQICLYVKMLFISIFYSSFLVFKSKNYPYSGPLTLYSIDTHFNASTTDSF